MLAAEGIEARVVDMRWVKPLDEEAIRAACDAKLLVTVEGGTVLGGAGEGVLGCMAAMGITANTLVLGIPDVFIPQGNSELLARDIGLDPEGVYRQIKEAWDKL